MKPSCSTGGFSTTPYVQHGSVLGKKNHFPARALAVVAGKSSLGWGGVDSSAGRLRLSWLVAAAEQPVQADFCDPSHVAGACLAVLGGKRHPIYKHQTPVPPRCLLIPLGAAGAAGPFPEELALLGAGRVLILTCATSFSPDTNCLVLPFSLFLSLLPLSPSLPSCPPLPEKRCLSKVNLPLGAASALPWFLLLFFLSWLLLFCIGAQGRGCALTPLALPHRQDEGPLRQGAEGHV